MDEIDPRDWTPAERDRLDKLKEVEPPDDGLKRRIVRQLEREGRIRPPRPATSVRGGWWTTAAASLVFFLLGLGLSPLVDSFLVEKTPDTRFLLLLIGGGGAEPPTAEAERRVREYTAWARLQRDAGTLLAGEKLAADGVALRGDSAAPAASAVGTVEGYFLIRASDERDAVRIAQTCPHLRYGGTVEVRRLE